MSDHVFVVSEWLPKEGKEQELWKHFKSLMALSKKERGCIRAYMPLGKSRTLDRLANQNIPLYCFKNISM